jgi:ribonucleoside-diphosphate reductase alpha chain
MNVIKSNGSTEPMKFDKISARIKKQCYGLNMNFINYDEISIKVINGLIDGITTSSIDILISEESASKATIHPDYSILASRIAISSLHKNTSKSFYKTMLELYKEDIVNSTFIENIQLNKDKIESTINYDRDFSFDYFGYKTLEKSYLLKNRANKILERPQHLWMRVSVAIHGDDIESIVKTYEYMSLGYFTHATPTLFNSGTSLEQLSSCFLLKIDDDSLNEIYKVLGDCAKISKLSGGIGISVSKIRAKGSKIHGTNGESDGIIPMLKVYNDTARYVNQGGGKRKGSFAIYIENWHDDIYEFLDLKKNSGKEEMRARDLFLALWVSDLFMKSVVEDGDWWLMCPNESKGLTEVYGEEFESLYMKYVDDGIFRRKIKARELWDKIIEIQIETGNPYILYKDHINNKSNQKNIGAISSSNLCAEVIEYTSKDEIAVCNLASIALPKFVENGKFNHEKLYEIAYIVSTNLDKVIDVNYYPVDEGKVSNNKHRPIGMGVQGLADVFALLKLPFDSDEAKVLNREIFETIYFAGVTASHDRAIVTSPYSTFVGSPLSQGIFQFDMWKNNTVENLKITSSVAPKLNGRWDWEILRTKVIVNGVRNSLIVALMPTASTGQILGNNECFEPYTSNIYARKTLSGTYTIVNKHLINDLIKIGIWNDGMRKQIISNDGSVQDIDTIPQNLKDVYKTVYELKMRDIIDMSADRGAFVCQTQSLNLYFPKINYAKVSGALMYGWLKGLKTGSYYIRAKAESGANKNLGLDLSSIKNVPIIDTILYGDEIACSLDDPESCLACSA